MTVLRSREIVSSTLQSQSQSQSQSSSSQTLLDKTTYIDPSTPAKMVEPSSSHFQSSPPTPNSSPSIRLGFRSDSIGLFPTTTTTTIRRRSLRLASSKSGSSETIENVSVSSPNRKILSVAEYNNTMNDVVLDLDLDLDLDLGVTKFIRVSEEDEIPDLKMGSDKVGHSMLISEKVTSGGATKPKGKRKLGVGGIDSSYPLKLMGEDEGVAKGFLRLRSGTKIAKKRVEGISVSGVVEIDHQNEGEGLDIDIDIEREGVLNGGQFAVNVMNEFERDQRDDDVNGTLNGTRISSSIMGGDKGKGKGKLVNEEALALIPNGVEPLDLDLRLGAEKSNGNAVSDAVVVRLLGNAALMNFDKIPNNDGRGSSSNKTRRRLSRVEKGKDKMVEDATSLLNTSTDAVELNSETKLEKLVDSINSFSSSISLAAENVVPQVEKQVTNTRVDDTRRREYKTRFRDIARQNASRFAHFSVQEEEENHVTDDAVDLPSTETAEREIEDWPGPFSTAMKIIKDRKMNVNVQQQNTSMDKNKPALFIWVPKKDHHREHSKQLVPSLQELSMSILVKNADAITSLDSVPDVLRHKLSQLLCDTRKMNGHFLDLLASGSPSEVRVRDCSWLTEEQFTRTFEGCKTDNLMVLQLDQCGRCMPDYILLTTLARSPNSLPALTTVSLKGACRLSDVGLSALVSSAPALRSINLSQCSLLTFKGISTLADSLGMVLRELYLDDCQITDPMLILPALKKLERLEVLSLAGIQTISDEFIRELITVRGPDMRELVLADCVKLTDSSLKVIGETCSGLCALDLVNLCKLTDSALGYLANGCQAIQTLKLCRNTFSDEAVAAFLETSGESLKELSLNNVIKVGQNTAISLAKRSRKLLCLDLSWCRNLTNEALGLIVDSCLSLKVLKLFGCSQVTKVFLNGHSNPQVQIVGLKMTPILEHLKMPDPLEGPLQYSSVSAGDPCLVS